MKGLNNAIRQHWDDGVQTMPSGSALPKNTLMTYIQIADNIDAATLKKGAAVAYVCFEDDTGLIFATLS